MISSVCLFLLLCIPPKNISQQKPAKVMVISQKQFINRGHHPERNRRIAFKVCNTSRVPLRLFGINENNNFDPTGYSLVFSQKSGKWIYPKGQVFDPGFDSISRLERDSYNLEPEQCLPFFADMSKYDKGKRLIRTVYISRRNEQPVEIRSSAFLLK